jgi:hypothetical protein
MDGMLSGVAEQVVGKMTSIEQKRLVGLTLSEESAGISGAVAMLAGHSA